MAMVSRTVARRLLFSAGLALVACAAPGADELREGSPHDREQRLRQDVRVINSTGTELNLSGAAVADLMVYQACQYRLRLATTGYPPSACRVSTDTPCSLALCAAEIDLCVAELLLDYRGVTAERARIETSATEYFDIPPQSTATNAILGEEAVRYAFQAMDDARVALANVGGAGCTTTQAAVTYGDTGAEVTIRAGLANIFVDAFYVARDATEASAADTIAVAESRWIEEPPLDTPATPGSPAVTAERLSRLAAARLLVGGRALPTEPAATAFCGADDLGGGAETALRLLREAAISPAAISSTASTAAIVNGSDAGSVRNRLAVLWSQLDLATGGATSLSYDELLEVLGVNEADLDAAREYLRQELGAFARDTTITLPDRVTGAGAIVSSRWAAVATAPTPLPAVYYASLARATDEVWTDSAIAPGTDSRRRHGFSGVIDYAFQNATSLLGTTAAGQDDVARPLSLFLSDVSTDYVGALTVAQSTATAHAFTLYLPGLPPSHGYTDYIIVTTTSALSCATRGSIETVPCSWPSTGILTPTSPTITTGLLPYRINWSFTGALPARVFLLARRLDAPANTPGAYEQLIGVPVPTWTVARSQTYPVVRSTETRAAEYLTPNPNWCSRPRTTCTGDREDGPIALENDLSADWDPRESSWRHYLELARRAAQSADDLGDDVLDMGLQIDLRSEDAAQTLEEVCGAAVDVDPFTALPLTELRGGPCSPTVSCAAGFRCQSNVCIRDLTDLLTESTNADAARARECIGSTQTVDFVGLGDRPMCLWYEAANSNAICTGGIGIPCPSHPRPPPPGTAVSVANCVRPLLANGSADPQFVPVLVPREHMLGLFVTDAEAVSRAGVVPPCRQIRELRNATTTDARAQLAAEIAQSGFFTSPSALRQIGSQVTWRAQPGNFSTLALGGVPRISTGDFMTGQHPSWPCAPRGMSEALPAGCPDASSLFCQQASCADATGRALYNDRLARAGVLARLLSGNDLSGFRMPFYPRYPVTADDHYRFTRVHDVVDYTASLLWSSASIMPGTETLPGLYTVPAYPSIDELQYRAYYGAWSRVSGGVVTPLGSSPVLFYEAPSWPLSQDVHDSIAEGQALNWSPAALESWLRTVASASALTATRHGFGQLQPALEAGFYRGLHDHCARPPGSGALGPVPAGDYCIEQSAPLTEDLGSDCVYRSYPFTRGSSVDRVMTDTRGGSTRRSRRDLLDA